MKGRNRIQWYNVALLAFCLTACQVKRPKDVLPDAKMEKRIFTTTTLRKLWERKYLITKVTSASYILNRYSKARHYPSYF